MANKGPHDALERRLKELGDRIAGLKNKVGAAGQRDKAAEMAEIEERHRDLEARLSQLRLDGPGFRNETKAAIARVADELAAAVDHWVRWVDSGFAADRAPARPR
jgi:outer membrane murein-binding lipoprotein Lpp